MIHPTRSASLLILVSLAGVAAGEGDAAAQLPAPARSHEQEFADAQSTFDSAMAELGEAEHDPVVVRQRFYASARAFEALAARGVASVNLYVNTANAYQFAGDEPRALLWYLRAERLANTPETRAGLAALRRACGAEPWPPPRTTIARVLMSWHYDLSRRTKQLLMLTLYPLGCGLLLVSFVVRRPRRWRRAGLVLLVLGGVMAVSDVVAATAPGEPWAVVLEPTSGRAGDGEAYSVVVEAIRAGQEVRRVETRGEWVQVELPGGTRCWIPADACEDV